MATTQNTTKTAATRRPASQAKSAASTSKTSAAKTAANNTAVVEKKVSPSAEVAQAATVHIADQIKGFARRRVWPD